jgi:phosphate transport system permease protein
MSVSLKNTKAGVGRDKADLVFKWIATGCAVALLLIIAAMAVSLIWESRLSLDKFGLGFISSQEWNPVKQDYGALTSIFGTLVSALIAMLIAVPLSLITALFLVELAPPKVSRVVGTGIELLAAVPSIIYGMWGLFTFAPYMADHVQPFLQDYLGFLPLFKGPPMGIGMLTAGIILALMILPFISAVTRDVFEMVPSVVKESAYGMGSTTWETTRHVTIRYGIKGILGACFLGLGRAIGETMAVTFVIGNNHEVSSSLFSAGNSIASTLANEFCEASEPLYLSSLVELGLVLFGITIVIQAIAHLWLKRMENSSGTGL